MVLFCSAPAQKDDQNHPNSCYHQGPSVNGQNTSEHLSRLRLSASLKTQKSMNPSIYSVSGVRVDNVLRKGTKLDETRYKSGRTRFNIAALMICGRSNCAENQKVIKCQFLKRRPRVPVKSPEISPFYGK